MPVAGFGLAAAGAGVMSTLASAAELPPLTGTRLLTFWQLDPLVAVVLLAMAALYLSGVHRLHRRGDRWPPGRTLSFLAGGIGTLAVATMSSIGAYDDTLFSTHMAQHMILTMVTPIFLALGAPVTLALRTLPFRPRRWLLAAVHSRAARVLSFPLLTLPLLVATLYGLYLTPIYEATLRNDTLHELLHVHFLITGCLFFWPLLGIDPVPGRLPHAGRALLAFLSLPIHAWLGVTLMSTTAVIAGDYYRELHRTWGPGLLEDQRLGGAILWVSGDLVGLLVFTALFVQWMRADERESRRVDRALDRHSAGHNAGSGIAGRERGADALAAYNARLAALARADDRADRGR